MEQIEKRLLSWASILEDQAREQAIRTASLPWIKPHVALMPDAHWGMGSTVGSVIPTADVVMPAAVGVDIGCFRGDTRVTLLNGRQKTLREMTEQGGHHWVYSINSSGQIVPGRAVALKTRTDAELMRIVVSGGEEIICTPDHEFMLNDGTYCEARDLRFNESLMPLYRRWQTRDGYESVSIGKGTQKMTHVLVYEAMNDPVPERHVVHHRNHIHFDNTPENLELMEAGEHSTYHRRVGHSFKNDCPDFQEKRVVAIRRSMSDPEMRARRAALGTANISRYMTERPEHYAAATAENGRRGAPYLEKFNTSPRACSDCSEEAANPAALRWHKKREHGYNHKVISVESLDERADVYCLQVEEHHNFALAAGVFVHNCGMAAVRTQLTAGDIEGRDLSVLREAIEREVPVSAGKYRTTVSETARGRVAELESIAADRNVNVAHSPKWREQLGTLGGGNHFIEISLDEQDRVWVFLHSGSRGVGNKIAHKHVKRAQELCAKWYVDLPHKDLAFLPMGTDDFWAYIRDLRWAQAFALANRAEMVDQVVACLGELMGQDIAREETINCHHNYTEQEHHYGRELWLTRKGAINAAEGKQGLIPGSMGTRSYVVTGKGNKAAFCSAPHGAGRNFSRTEARKRFTVDQLNDAMKGIEWRSDNANAFLDEIPGAYKDIDQIMVDAADLVSINHTLRQILNVKGD